MRIPNTVKIGAINFKVIQTKSDRKLKSPQDGIVENFATNIQKEEIYLFKDFNKDRLKLNLWLAIIQAILRISNCQTKYDNIQDEMIMLYCFYDSYTELANPDAFLRNIKTYKYTILGQNLKINITDDFNVISKDAHGEFVPSENTINLYKNSKKSRMFISFEHEIQELIFDITGNDYAQYNHDGFTELGEQICSFLMQNRFFTK